MRLTALFGTKVFDIKDPFSDKGNIPLSSKDLASKEALNSWLKASPEAQIISGPLPPNQLISGEMPSIKFTLRLTPKVDRYLNWKAKRLKKTKADLLREWMGHLLSDDSEYLKFLNEREHRKD